MNIKYKLLIAALIIVAIPVVLFANIRSASTSTTAPTISVATDPTTPPAGIDVMGSTGNILAIFRIAETSNLENVKITSLAVTDVVAVNTLGSFTNVKLWNGSTLLGTAGAPVVGSGMYKYTFNFAVPPVVPQGSSVPLTLTGDALSYTSGEATDDAVHQWKILAGGVIAVGMSSNRAAKVTLLTPKGNPITVLRSTVTAAASPLGLQTGRAKSASDQLGTVSFTANTAGPIALNTVKVSLAGSALTAGGLTFVKSFQLIDQNGNNVTADGAKVTFASSSIQWAWAAGANGFNLGAGNTYNFGLRANSALIPSSNIGQTLVANILNSADVSYTDGLDASAVQKLHFPANAVPITINAITYASASSSGTGQLTASENSALGTVTVSPGVTNQKISSYTFSASSVEGANVSSVSIMPGVGYFQNLRVLVNSAQFGSTQGTVASGATYTFSGTSFTVPAGSSVNVDVYADILSNASGSASAATTLSGCAATGAAYSDSILCNAPVQGQSIGLAIATSSTLGVEESEMVRTINRVRSDAGLPSLQVSASLTNAALWMANDMAANAWTSSTMQNSNNNYDADTLGRNLWQRISAFGYFGGTQSYNGEMLIAGQADALSTFYEANFVYELNTAFTTPYATVIGVAHVYAAPLGWYWVIDYGGATVDQTLSLSPPPTPNSQTQIACTAWNNAQPASWVTNWTGNVTSCNAGTIDSGSIQGTLSLVNYYRNLNGLPAVTESSTWDQQAQSCSLIQAANINTYGLNHFPQPSWSCYSSSGATGAEQSLLASTNAQSSIPVYMEDPATPSFGHRSWILSNNFSTVGVGSTPITSCLNVVGGNRIPNPTPWVAWPSPGVVPINALLSVDYTGWSIHSDTINLGSAQVSVQSGGINLPVTVAQANGYGANYGISFVPVGWHSTVGNTYTVSVTGISSPINYSVTIVGCY